MTNLLTLIEKTHSFLKFCYQLPLNRFLPDVSCVCVCDGLAAHTRPASHMTVLCVCSEKLMFKLPVIRFCLVKLGSALASKNRLDRRHSSLHPDNRIAPVTTLSIGRSRHVGEKTGRSLRERCIMGGGVSVDWRVGARFI